jgi:hypothetical protein
MNAQFTAVYCQIQKFSPTKAKRKADIQRFCLRNFRVLSLLDGSNRGTLCSFDP